MTGFQDKGYIVVSLASDENDQPTRDPAQVAKEIADAGIPGVVETRCAMRVSDHRLVEYGESYLAESA